MTLAIILFGAFLTVAGLSWALVGARENRVGERALRYAGSSAVLESSSFGGDESRPMRLPRKWETFLARAGVEWSAGQLVFVAGLYAIGGFAAGHFLRMSLVGAVLGLGVLYMKLRLQQGQRQKKMGEQMPDALMMMGSALQSGLGFQQALQMVAKEGAAPLAPEFGKLASDLMMGLNFEAALARLQSRLGNTEGEMLCAALLVQRQTGGNLSEILNNLQTTIRNRQEVMGQIQALTAEGKMSGIVLMLLPVGVGFALWVMNPTYISKLFTDPRGHLMLAATVASIAIGGFWISRVVKIKY